MTKMNNPGALPDYSNPPVIETVLGLQFDSLQSLTNGHLGAFWRTLPNDEWPTVSDAPLLGSQHERFDDPSQWRKDFRVQFTSGAPKCRVKIRNQLGDRMIQVQDSRFHLNWLRTEGKAYPRYEAIRDEFIPQFDHFQDFVRESGLVGLRINQWEITYVNQIPRGTVWESPADWGFFLPLNGVPTIPELIEGESYTGEWHFVIPPRRGRLHIQWQHDRGDDGSPDFVRLVFTARGPLGPMDAAPEEIRASLDLGRATIVKAFRNLMSDSANSYWGLNNG